MITMILYTRYKYITILNIVSACVVRERIIIISMCGSCESRSTLRGRYPYQAAAARTQKKRRTPPGACTRNRAARLATNVCLDGHGRARPCGRRGTEEEHTRAARVYTAYIVAVPPPPPPPPVRGLWAPARSRFSVEGPVDTQTTTNNAAAQHTRAQHTRNTQTPTRTRTHTRTHTNTHTDGRTRAYVSRRRLPPRFYTYTRRAPR